MSVPRGLPKIDVGGTMFYIDLRLDEFRQVDNPFNRIHLDELYETINGYALCFDPQTKNVFNGSEGEFGNRKDLVKVDLPPLEQMDPVGFNQLVNRWSEDNPVLTALIQSIPVVRENETKTIGAILKEKPQLLEKKRLKHSKGKRL
jgi:hypothetical protein